MPKDIYRHIQIFEIPQSTLTHNKKKKHEDEKEREKCETNEFIFDD